MNYKEFLKLTGFNDKDILNVYHYGSVVYNTCSNTSDNDFIVITSNKIEEQYLSNSIDITFYTPIEFETKLKEHEISILECYYLPEYHILKELLHFEFKLDLQKLRTSISSKSSNSFVKAKKKITLENEINLGKKSLWHSFRILYFGIQLASQGKIFDYQEANSLYYDILSNSNDWDSLFKKYKKEYNELSSLFKLVAPKNL